MKPITPSDHPEPRVACWTKIESEWIQQYALDAVIAEREACAKLCLEKHANGNWKYDTVIASASADLVAHEVNDESHEVRWVEVEEISELTLHPSFAASWPKVKELVLKLIGQSL